MSLLSKQISRLRQAANFDDTRKGRPASLLFSPSDAAEIDAVSLLEVAKGALDGLAQRDARFGEFSATLFHASSVSLDRSLLTAAENERLDIGISRVLLLLSPHCDTKPAHRVLEYLIRQYHVERMNVEAVVDCCLPFHDTPMFTRLLQILHLDAPGSLWVFLKGFRQRGQPVPRSALAERAAHDPALLAFIGDMLFRASDAALDKQGLEEGREGQARVSWYAATLIAAVECREPSEDFLRTLVPQLVKGMSLARVPAVQVGCFLVTMKLTETGVLSTEILEMLLVAILKTPSPHCAVEAVTCVATVVNHADISELSGPVFALLRDQRPVEDLLLAAGAHVDVTKLASFFLVQLAEGLKDEAHAATDLCRAIACLPVATAIPTVVRRTLAILVENPAASESVCARLADVIASCALNFALPCDAEIRDVLAGLDDRSAGKAAIFALLAANSSVTMCHMPLEEVSVPFLIALEHEDFKVRISAVNRAAILAAEGGVPSDIHAAVLRRFDDDHPGVIAALSNGAALLAQCSPDPEARLKVIGRAFRRCSDGLWGGSEAHAPAVAAMLILIGSEARSGGEAALTTAVLAHLEHLPSRAVVKLKGNFEALGRQALSGALELAAAGAGLLGSLTAAKKGALPSAGEVSRQLATHLAAGTKSSAVWLEVAAGKAINMGGVAVPLAVRVLLLDAVSASARVPKSNVALGLDVIFAALPTLRQRTETSTGVSLEAENQSALVDVLTAVVMCAPQGHEAMSEVFGHILRLPADCFAEAKVQAALHRIVGHHFNMEPLRHTAAVYAAPSSASLGPTAATSRMRALGISTTFVLAVGAGNVAKGKAEAALNDVFATLPHVITCLEHSEQSIRDASLGLLAAVCDCAKLDALKSATAALAQGAPASAQGAPKVPALKAADMFKLCGSLCARKAEISMDCRNLGPCMASLFMGESADRAWKKAQSACFASLVALAVNLGFLPGAHHIGRSLLGALSWRFGKVSGTPLNTHAASAWPCCEALSSYSLATGAHGGDGMLWCAIDSFVFAPVGGVAEGHLALVTGLFTAAHRSPGTFSALVDRCMRSMDAEWCSKLSPEQSQALFSALLGLPRAANASQVVRHMKLSAADFAGALRPATASHEWLLRTTSVLETIGAAVPELRDAGDNSKAVVALLDDLFAVVTKCTASVSVDVDADDLAACLELSLDLCLGNMASIKTSSRASQLVTARVSAYTEALRGCIEAPWSPASVKAFVTRVLASLAQVAPGEMLETVTAMVKKLGADASSSDDFHLFKCTEQILTQVLPHLRGGAGDALGTTVGSLLRDLLGVFRGAPMQRQVSICTSLVACLSSAVLPAIVTLSDPALGLVLVQRSKPEDQMMCAAKLLECASLATRSAWSDNDGPTLISLSGGDSGHRDGGFMVLDLSLAAVNSSEMGALAVKCASFVAAHTECRGLHFQLVRLSAAAEKRMQTLHLHVCQQLLSCLRDASDVQSSSGAVDAQLQRELLAALDRSLSNVQGLLSVSGFIAVAQELLGDDDERVRRRALELLSGRIDFMEREGRLSKNEIELFVDMLPELTAALSSTGAAELQPTALCAVDILARHFASAASGGFLAALGDVTELIRLRKAKESNVVDDSVTSSAFLCAATLCGALGTRSFPHLPRLMPLALETLKSANARDGAVALFRPALAMVVALVQHLPQFVHPHLEALLALTIEPGPLRDSDDVPLRQLMRRLTGALATGVHLRLLLPAVVTVFPQAVAASATVGLLDFFQLAVAAASQRDVRAHLVPAAHFLLDALALREHHFLEATRQDADTVDATERAVTEALVALVLRMNEIELAAVFVDLYEWKLAAAEGSRVASLCRRVAFFRVAEVLADRLRSIFVPFFEHFFDDCRAELDAVFESPSSTGKAKKRKLEKVGASGANDTELAVQFFDALTPPEQALQTALLRAVTGSLRLCFQHDGLPAFVTSDRVASIAPSLVRHLALAPSDSLYVTECTVPCIAHLAAAAASDVAWKPLNFAVLMHTRDSSGAVRLAALDALGACFSLVGEEYLIMLPESLSFLSELLEDCDASVEAKCRALLKEVEAMSGERLEAFM